MNFRVGGQCPTPSQSSSVLCSYRVSYAMRTGWKEWQERNEVQSGIYARPNKQRAEQFHSMKWDRNWHFFFCWLPVQVFCLSVRVRVRSTKKQNWHQERFLCSTRSLCFLTIHPIFVSDSVRSRTIHCETMSKYDFNCHLSLISATRLNLF